jgi:hypothetical protein
LIPFYRPVIAVAGLSPELQTTGPLICISGGEINRSKTLHHGSKGEEKINGFPLLVLEEEKKGGGKGS